MAEAVVRLKVDATNANKALSGVQQRTDKLQGLLVVLEQLLLELELDY